MALGDVVRLWRQELGWKQVELARRSEGLLSQANISDLERNKYPSPSIETLEGVAVAFGVSVDTLLRAARMPPEGIPSVAEALPPETAGLPPWVRDFHRWGTRMTPAQRRSVLDLARTLAEEAARQEAAELPADVETDEHSAKGR
jgi:transcriptional regulator with XRE-family HTH domain